MSSNQTNSLRFPLPERDQFFCAFVSLGGGVMGSPGWNAALIAMADLKRR